MSRFLPRDAMHKRGLCRHAVSVCLSVCLSVRPSVTFVDHVKMNKDIFEIFSPLGRHTILFFPYQTGWRYSDGNLPNGGIECRIQHKSRFWSNSWLLKIAGRAKCQKHLPTTKLSIWHIRPRIDRLLDVRTTKWQNQLPTTMQCRSHSRRLTSECLFVTACSMDEYFEEKRTKKNLIVRSGKSEAETTNNKRLRSTFCIEATADTKHRAASLR